jgi:hypothetical protein
LPQGRLKYCHGNVSYEDFHPGPRPPELVATSGACSH